MLVVVCDHKSGVLTSNSLEALSFGEDLARNGGKDLVALVPGGLQDHSLQSYRLRSVFTFPFSGDHATAEEYLAALLLLAQRSSPECIIFSYNSLGKALGGQLAIRLNAGLISNVCGFEWVDGRALFKKSVFSGKAYAWCAFQSETGLVAILPKAYGINQGQSEQVPEYIDLGPLAPDSRMLVVERTMSSGKTPLTEADVVVSGGRGLKDPANWGMVESLAELLHAGTACSRPVADAGWRPHHEHVGQTGTAIRPKVYIAIGISGAIQHLAGVNNSRTIIVINKDPEAPFFKAADYGVCGDLFEVVPKLIQALQNGQ
ncbi:MAG: electron transfer flavoprotein subunit alpha/FixB family protein [Saprospiraceae bacterium]|nr:electron transfer flavoprotein subunit alpha/FixB family protein [Saprospiraceae bacterium]